MSMLHHSDIAEYPLATCADCGAGAAQVLAEFNGYEWVVHCGACYDYAPDQEWHPIVATGRTWDDAVNDWNEQQEDRRLELAEIGGAS